MDVFAEIEYEFKPNNAQKTEAQQLVDTGTDPIRRVFYDMRGLASNNPYTWNDARLFYRQAKFMENFTDDYEQYADYSMHYPCYQRMGYERLRTYFTWRAKLRRGEFSPASLSYVFLYIYEVLSCIGSDRESGPERLIDIREKCREPALDEYLPAWLKDFHIYYNPSGSFADFIEKHGLRGHYSEMFLFSANAQQSLDAWSRISGYDITKSKFYNASPENAELCRSCFGAVVSALEKLCVENGSSLKELLARTDPRNVTWVPFRRALFHPWFRQNDRQVELPGGEMYFCKNNEWTATYSAPYAHRKEFAGFLIKKTEACLRDAAGFKKISADPAILYKVKQTVRELKAEPSEFRAAIERTVAAFLAEMNRVVVNVDPGNLARIREEASDTQDKLIVEDREQRAEGRGEQAEMLITPLPKDGWAALREALSETERQALALAIEGGDVKAFAVGNDIMLEVLADGINEKAMDIIGDNILDLAETFEMYDEYKDNIRACSHYRSGQIFAADFRQSRRL